MGEFYQELQKFCEGGASGKGDKDAGDKKIDKAKKAQGKAAELREMFRDSVIISQEAFP